MGRKIRKIKKRSKFAVNSAAAVVLIVMIFFVLMAYWTLDARCASLNQDIGKAEKELGRLEQNLQRENSRLEELKTPDNLRMALIRHGLDMHQAGQEQVVRMGADGRPAAGQMSVARIRARRRIGRMASSGR